MGASENASTISDGCLLPYFMIVTIYFFTPLTTDSQQNYDKYSVGVSACW